MVAAAALTAPAARCRGRYHRPVRKLLKWAAVTAALAGLARWLKRRGRRSEEGATAEPDHAEELRRKLAESRTGAEEGASEPAPEPEATVEERRAEVHEQGRATVDEMNPPGSE